MIRARFSTTQCILELLSQFERVKITGFYIKKGDFNHVEVRCSMQRRESARAHNLNKQVMSRLLLCRKLETTEDVEEWFAIEITCFFLLMCLFKLSLYFIYSIWVDHSMHGCMSTLELLISLISRHLIISVDTVVMR